MLAAVAAGFASCSIREMAAPEAPVNGIDVTVNASMGETKTVFGDPSNGVIPVTWAAEGEVVELIEYIDGAASQAVKSTGCTVENNGMNAKFQFTLAEKTGTEFQYYGVYPASAYRAASAESLFDYAWAVDPQHPTLQGPDPAYCILMSKLPAQSAQQAELNMAFEHVTTYVKFSLKNTPFAEGEELELINVEIPGKDLAGRYRHYADSVTVYGTTNTPLVAISPDNLDTKSGSFDVWMACKPFALKAGEKAYVKLKTPKRVITKEITAPADMDFSAGSAFVLGLDMTTADAPRILEPNLTLSFDFSTAKATLPSWPTAKGNTVEAVYPLDGTDYTFEIKDTYAAASQLTSEAGGYVRIPVIPGATIVSINGVTVKAKASYACSITEDPEGTKVVTGGEKLTWNVAGDHLYVLSGTKAETPYYIYANGPLPINKIVLNYYVEGEAPTGDQIEAYMETVFAAGKSAWAKGDVIGVLDKTATTPFVAQADGASVNFTGTLSEGTEQYAAVYPYNDGMGINASNNVVVSGAMVCPSTQTVADGSNLPIYAPFVNKGEKLAFQPLGAALKFTIDSEYAGKFTSIKFTDPSGKAKMTGETGININLSTGNAASKTAYVVYAPESANIPAGTYYLGIYTPNTRYTLSDGLVCAFTMTTGQAAELTIPAEVVGAAEAVPGMILDLGTLKPELPGMATYSPYNYPAEPAPAFNPIPNFLYNKAAVKVVENADVVDNVLVLKGVDGVSTAGAKIGAYSKDGVAKAPTAAGANVLGNTYFTTKGWQAGDYILYEIPVSQAVKGDIAFSFNLSCGKADKFTGTWKPEWSSDNTNWEAIGTVYNSVGANNGGFCINDNGTTYNNGVSTAKFNIPDAKALKSGDKLYVKLTIDTDCTDQAQTLRMNGGSLVYPWPVNTDFSGDPNVILSQNFASLCKASYDVLGVFNGEYYSEKLTIPAIEGWEFNACHERLTHILVNGNATTTGYIQTPALTALTAPTDIIVTFKASTVETPNVGVVVEGAGTVDPDGPFWTKSLADSPYKWTIGYVKISGADATTQVKITSNANLDVDDIVITK